MTACTAAGCDRSVTARGMCRMHYLRARRAGTLSDAPLRDRSTGECPSDHPHDLEGCWGIHGCRCARCVHLRKMDRQRRRNRLAAYGRTDEIREARVPAAPVKAHLVALRAQGLGLERIADAANVSRSLVQDVFYGPRGTTKAARAARAETERTVRASYAARLLSLTPDQVEAAFVSPTGTVRRLRALVAVGYTQTALAAHLGMQTGNFSPLIHGRRPRVTRATHDAVSRMFADLWATPQVGEGADIARRVAKSRRWAGPLAWDDIDDPAEQVNLGPKAVGDEVDHMAVELAMSGEDVRLTPAERRIAVERLHAERWSDSRIAATLHVTDRTVLRIRQELGLEAFDQNDLINWSAA